MGANERLHEAVAALKPLRQGQLDGLCGLYGIINWLKLSLYPAVKFTPGEERWLFEHGIEFLEATGKLPIVMTIGMSPALWRRVCQSMEAEASSLTGIAIKASSAFPSNITSEQRLVAALCRHLDNGRPIITTFWGRYNHTTVAVGYTDKRLKLFDSWGLRWIELRTLGVKHVSDARHQIAPSGTLVLKQSR